MAQTLSSETPMVIERTTCEKCDREIEEVGNWYECSECRGNDPDNEDTMSQYDEAEAEARNEFAQVAEHIFGQTEWNGIPVYWSDALSCYVTIPE